MKVMSDTGGERYYYVQEPSDPACSDLTRVSTKDWALHASHCQGRVVSWQVVRLCKVAWQSGGQLSADKTRVVDIDRLGTWLLGAISMPSAMSQICATVSD